MSEGSGDVLAYCWEVNADHPRLVGKLYSGSGERVSLGDRGPWWALECVALPEHNPWGLTQVWRLRNGQEVRARWKAVTSSPAAQQEQTR